MGVLHGRRFKTVARNHKARDRYRRNSFCREIWKPARNSPQSGIKSSRRLVWSWPGRSLTVLAAILFVHGEKSGALKVLDDALLERKGALPAKRLPLEAARKRMADVV